MVKQERMVRLKYLKYDFVSNQGVYNILYCGTKVDFTDNLEKLMILSYNIKLKDTPFLHTHQIPIPLNQISPFRQIER